MTTTQRTVKLLSDQLIEAETGLTLQSDPENFNLCRNFVHSKFKTHTFGRTNQFDVAARLEGLEEKFFVCAAPTLASCLHDRIAALPPITGDPSLPSLSTNPVNPTAASSASGTASPTLTFSFPPSLLPEVLHLLLELSSRPLEHAQDSLAALDALEEAREREEKEGTRKGGRKTGERGGRLTWDEILEEEPLEGEIWEDVDFGAESSEPWSDDETGEVEVG